MFRIYSALMPEVPNGDAAAPGELGAKFNNLVGYAKYLGFSVCVLALIGAAAMMAISHRRGGDGGEAEEGEGRSDQSVSAARQVERGV